LSARGRPLAKTAKLYTFRLITDSEESSIKTNRKSTMSFPRSHQPRSCVTSNFVKMGFRYPNLTFFSQKFRQKTLKVCHKVSLSKNFQRHSCSAINYLSSGINIVVGDDPIPVKFGPKATDPNRKDARFTFHTRRAVQSFLSCKPTYSMQ